MQFARLARKLIAVGDKLSKSMQTTVKHEAFKSQSDSGKVTYQSAVNRRAIVELDSKLVRTMAGLETRIRARVTFLTETPIDERDKITLPSGMTGPIYLLDGFVDADTGKSFYTEIGLG